MDGTPLIQDDEIDHEAVHGGLILEGHAVEVVDYCVRNGQVVDLEAYMASKKNAAAIRENAWDIVPKVCNYLTDENVTENPEIIDTCEVALKYLSEVGNHKEMLLALLEQADAFKDNVKFKILLPPIQRCLLKLQSKRGYSLAIGLETLMGHIEALSIPEDRNLEGKERMLLDGDEKVIAINDAVMCVLNFLMPFVDEVSINKIPSNPSKDQLKQRSEIIKFCLRLLGRPLIFLDLSVSHKKPSKDKHEQNSTEQSNGPDALDDKPDAKEVVVKSANRYCAEKLMTVISKLHGNPISLLEFIMVDNLRIERDCKRLKSIENGEGEAEDDGIVLEEAIPDEALGTFSYLVFSENLGQGLLPAIYSHRFIFEACFPFSSKLLKYTYSLVTYKGVKLLLAIANDLPPGSLSTDIMESDSTQDLLTSLIAIMTRSHMKELRQSAAQVVPHLLQSFDSKGKYLFLNFMLKKSVGNWGVRGLISSLLKDEIDANLKLEKPSDFFIGTHLERLLNVVFSLPKGAETDLLECSDHIMAALNLLRYLILRDNPSDNITGLWNYIPLIKANYLEVLRTGINMSRAHYELEMKNIKEKKGARSPGGVDTNFHIAGQPVPQLTMQQQTQAMQMAVSTFDMMESIVVRVSELLDQQKTT